MSETQVSSVGSDGYHYIAVKGSPYGTDCAVFGLAKVEVVAMTAKFPSSGTEVVNGVMIKGPPLAVLNALAELDYRVVCSTGEAEIVWTLLRED